MANGTLVGRKNSHCRPAAADGKIEARFSRLLANKKKTSKKNKQERCPK